MVQQRPWLTIEIKTRLLESRVSYSGVVDHRSRRSVFSQLRSCVDRCHVWPNWASGGKLRWMIEHISINRPVWMGFDDLKHLVACCFAVNWRWSHIREDQKPWDQIGMQAAWNQAHETVKLSIYETGVAGSCPHTLGSSIMRLSTELMWRAESTCTSTPWRICKFHDQVITTL